MKKNNFSRKEPVFFISRAKNPHLIAAFGTKRFNFSFKNISLRSKKKNRERFLKKLGINYKELILPQQVHGSKISCVNKKHKGKGALSYKTAIGKTDGLVTQQKNIPIGVLTADCLSILLCELKTGTIGAVHAGWRGTYKQIAKKAVALLVKKFKVSAKDLDIFLGPAIRSCCYEVGGEFKKYFSPEFLKKRNNKFYFDLVKANKKQLVDSGVRVDKIFDCKICSCCDDNFFSYRREGKKTGRTVSLIALK